MENSNKSSVSDKSEVGGEFASVSEPKFKPLKGASALRQGWSGVAAQPLLAEKIKLSPVRRSVSDAA